MTACFVVVGCGNADRLEKTDEIKPKVAADLFLSPMQSEGLQYFATFSKQQQATADALKRVKKAMENLLFDPASGRYAKVRVGRNGAVCGQYNAKNRYGAYVGFKDFVLSGDGRVVTSDTNGGYDASTNSDYIEAYLNGCGTKAEIAAHRADTILSNISDYGSTDTPTYQEPDRVLDARPSPPPASNITTY